MKTRKIYNSSNDSNDDDDNNNDNDRKKDEAKVKYFKVMFQNVLIFEA